MLGQTANDGPQGFANFPLLLSILIPFHKEEGEEAVTNHIVVHDLWFVVNILSDSLFL